MPLYETALGPFTRTVTTTMPERAVLRGLWDFARGYAYLRTGDVDSARAYLAIVDEAAITLGDSTSFRGHTATNLLGTTGGILRAELAREDGDMDGAIAALEVAIAFEDSLSYDEPEPLNFSARHWLGAILLEADRPADSEGRHSRSKWGMLKLERLPTFVGRDVYRVRAFGGARP